MINFRYHIVTVVSIFLALAVGIALGGGPLKGGVDNSLVNELKVRTDSDNRRGVEIQRLNAQGAFSKALIEDRAPQLLKDELTGHSIAIIALPGSTPATVDTLTRLVRTAGGNVVGRYRYGSQLNDEGDAEDLGDQIARVIAAGDPRPFGPTSRRLLAGLEADDLFSAEQDPTGRADGVIVISGGSQDTDDARAHEREATIAGRLALTAASVTVVGPANSARSNGLLAHIREDVSLSAAVSTVDSASSGAGSLITMMALSEGLRTGETGHYGAVRPADGPFPLR